MKDLQNLFELFYRDVLEYYKKESTLDISDKDKEILNEYIDNMLCKFNRLYAVTFSLMNN